MGCGKARQENSADFTGSVCRPTENNVLLRPDMNAAAVHTGELLHLHCGRLPALFVDRLSGIGEFCSGRTTHEKTLDVRASLCF